MQDDEITKLLVEEYQETRKRITEFMVVDERLLATGVSVLATAASVAIGTGRTYFLLAVPLAFAAVLCFADFSHSEVLALGGYNAALEEAIEVRTGVPVSGW